MSKHKRERANDLDVRVGDLESEVRDLWSHVDGLTNEVPPYVHAPAVRVGEAPAKPAHKKLHPALVILGALVGLVLGGFPCVLWLFYVACRDYLGSSNESQKQPTDEEARAQEAHDLGHFKYEVKRGA